MKAFQHIVLCATLFASTLGFAQDAIVTQFWSLPSLINPAATGDMENDYRATTNYRNQWGSVTQPYITTTAAVELAAFKRKSGSNGFGLYVRNDRAAGTEMRIFELAGQAAFHLTLSTEDFLGFGLTAGYRQRSINIEGLAWDSQFNGIAHDPSLPSGELFAGDRAASMDAAFGMQYRRRGNKHFNAGYAAWHYFQPNGFLDKTQDRVLVRHQIDFSWREMYGPVLVDYDFIAAKQGGAITAVAGARAAYRLGGDSKYTNALASNAVFGGIHYRWADAVLVSAGFEYQRSLRVGISYDFTASRLQQIQRMQSAWEMSLVWAGWFPRNRIRLR